MSFVFKETLRRVRRAARRVKVSETSLCSHRWLSSGSRTWSPQPAATADRETETDQRFTPKHDDNQLIDQQPETRSLRPVSGEPVGTHLVWKAVGHDVHLEGDCVHETPPPGQTVFICRTRDSSTGGFISWCMLGKQLMHTSTSLHRKTEMFCKCLLLLFSEAYVSSVRPVRCV